MNSMDRITAAVLDCAFRSRTERCVAAARSGFQQSLLSEYLFPPTRLLIFAATRGGSVLEGLNIVF